MKPGESNGKALGHIYNGETPEQLRQRYRNGELPGVNPEIVKNAFALKGIKV